VTHGRPESAADERFAEIYTACYGRVYAYAARRVGAQAAEDVVAETFTIAWRRLEDIPAEPLPWLYGVARNVVMRHRAGHARQDAAERALAAEPRAAATAEADGDPALWQAWETLSARDREVLALVAWEELTVRDAAWVLGCPAAVFSVRLHRARKRLERRLEHHNPSPLATLSEVR
jgi:RNA polymerase sigma-70 factor (ECF subfamily)